MNQLRATVRESTALEKAELTTEPTGQSELRRIVAVEAGKLAIRAGVIADGVKRASPLRLTGIPLESRRYFQSSALVGVEAVLVAPLVPCPLTEVPFVGVEGRARTRLLPRCAAALAPKQFVAVQRPHPLSRAMVRVTAVKDRCLCQRIDGASQIVGVLGQPQGVCECV